MHKRCCTNKFVEHEHKTVAIVAYIKLAVFTTPTLNPFGFSTGVGVEDGSATGAVTDLAA
jgi:hypothetical protein